MLIGVYNIIHIDVGLIPTWANIWQYMTILFLMKERDIFKFFKIKLFKNMICMTQVGI